MDGPNTGKPTARAPFEFPRAHDFPPMYTLQPNEATRQAQMDKWAHIVTGYCAHHHLSRLSSSAAAAGVFSNARIRRALPEAAQRDVWARLQGEGRAEPDGAGGWLVFWRRPDEWAGLLEAWVDTTAQRGSVLTLYELAEGEATRGTDLHGLDRDVLLRALGVLVKKGRAEIFGADDSQGVKFF